MGIAGYATEEKTTWFNVGSVLKSCCANASVPVTIVKRTRLSAKIVKRLPIITP